MFGTQLGASNGHEPLLGRSQRVLLEVCTVLYFFAKNSAIPLVQQYIYYLVAKKYNYSSKMDETLPELIMNVTNKHVNDSILMPNASSYLHVDDQGHLVPPANSTLAPEEKETNDLISIAHKVNEESSLIVLYLNVAELFPAVFMVLVLGCWSDMTGKRKFLMWLPCLGNAVYALGFLLPIYISGGDIDHPATKVLFVLASLISGLSGSVPGYLSGNASYISDTDSPRRRTLRLAIVEFSIGTTFGLANLINGFWVDLTNHFEQPLWFVVLCSLIPFVVLCFLLREPHGELSSQLGQPSEASHVWRDFRGVLHVFGCKTLPQKKLWAVFFAFQVYVFVQQGQERTFVLFLQNFPLYWQPLQTGIFLFILYTLAGLGSWPGIPLLQRIMDDASIAILAMISKLLGSLLLAFAEVDPLVYLGESKWKFLYCHDLSIMISLPFLILGFLSASILEESHCKYSLHMSLFCG